VALICTSGTAAANYFPAMVEAHYSRAALLALTAERPHELRDVGAPQAIEQSKMYGDYVKWLHETAVAESASYMLTYVRSQAKRAVHGAAEGNAGVVHLNFPFREPLVPDFTLNDLWKAPIDITYHPVYEGIKRIPDDQLTRLIEKLRTKQRGVLV